MTTAFVTIITALILLAYRLTSGLARLQDPAWSGSNATDKLSESGLEHQQPRQEPSTPTCFALVRALSSAVNHNKDSTTSFGQACLTTVDAAANVWNMSVHITVPDVWIVQVKAWAGPSRDFPTTESDSANYHVLIEDTFPAVSRRQATTIVWRLGSASVVDKVCHKDKDDTMSKRALLWLVAEISVMGLDDDAHKPTLLSLDGSPSLRLACPKQESAWQQHTMGDVALPEAPADLVVARGGSSLTGTLACLIAKRHAVNFR